MLTCFPHRNWRVLLCYLDELNHLLGSHYRDRICDLHDRQYVAVRFPDDPPVMSVYRSSG